MGKRNAARVADRAAQTAHPKKGRFLEAVRESGVMDRSILPRWIQTTAMDSNLNR